MVAVVADPLALKGFEALLVAAGAFGCWWAWAWFQPRIRRNSKALRTLASFPRDWAYGAVLTLAVAWIAVILAPEKAAIYIRWLFVVALAAFMGLAFEWRARYAKQSVGSHETRATTLVNKVRMLCKAILDFVAERESLSPGANLPRPMDPIDPQFTAATSAEFRRIQADANRYAAQTIALFNSKFATDARTHYNDLRDNHGLSDADLDAGISFPANTHVMTWIATRLNALSAQLEGSVAVQAGHSIALSVTGEIGRNKRPDWAYFAIRKVDGSLWLGDSTFPEPIGGPPSHTLADQSYGTWVIYNDGVAPVINVTINLAYQWLQLEHSATLSLDQTASILIPRVESKRNMIIRVVNATSDYVLHISPASRCTFEAPGDTARRACALQGADSQRRQIILTLFPGGKK